MRYLLLSVLVVCMIGIMIPSAFASHIQECENEINGGQVCKSTSDTPPTIQPQTITIQEDTIGVIPLIFDNNNPVGHYYGYVGSNNHATFLQLREDAHDYVSEFSSSIEFFQQQPNQSHNFLVMHPKWQICPDACAGHGSSKYFTVVSNSEIICNKESFTEFPQQGQTCDPHK